MIRKLAVCHVGPVSRPKATAAKSGGFDDFISSECETHAPQRARTRSATSPIPPGPARQADSRTSAPPTQAAWIAGTCSPTPWRRCCRSPLQSPQTSRDIHSLADAKTRDQRLRTETTASPTALRRRKQGRPGPDPARAFIAILPADKKQRAPRARPHSCPESRSTVC